MTDVEHATHLAVWRRAGFHEYAVDFSGIDDELIRSLTVQIERFLDPTVIDATIVTIVPDPDRPIVLMSIRSRGYELAAAVSPAQAEKIATTINEVATFVKTRRQEKT